MTPLDFGLTLILASYVWVGLTAGLIQSLGSLLGVVLAALAASRWFNLLTPVFESWVGGPVPAAVIAFIIIFLAVSRGVGFVFTIINRLFNVVALLPGVRVTNVLGGGLFGFLEGVFAIGITLHFLARLAVSQTVTDALDAAALVPIFAGAAGWLVGLLPELLRQAQSVLT